ncbi:MAG: ABC transporter ATP-binding protein [Acidobacteria bacterium]|nr:ABC transporter ATP-binding protein [Acidobacteriota bacterium]
MAIIEVDRVSKTFPRAGEAKLLRTHIEEMFRRKRHDPFYALKNVSFRLEKGENLGVIGGNGAGKTTLLSLVSGLCRPEEGTVAVSGRVAPMLELGSGFHPELTGKENVMLNASLLGLSRRRTEECFGRIVEFSGVGDFINQPIRTYSSGMIVRLAFSVAAHVDPDILLIDEVLAVGDQAFQAKCFDRIKAFRSAGKTLLFVSHAPGLVKELCERCLWLDHGQVMMDGPADEVLAAYQARGR